ncbi:MAG TPA: alpha/beta fold hydrolase [Ramlibacter sp.]|nr:alpha/beta fold hydrolase [Ramlibacter sp.]
MQVNFRVRGDGDPAIVFVHGYGCALADWDAPVAQLSRHFTCVALDLPGHGESPLPQQPTLQALADAVNAVRASIGGRKVVLVGHSLGTRVINDAYLQQPEGVAGLVFVDGRYYEGQPDEVVARMASFIDRAGFAGFIAQAFQGMFTERSDPALRDRITTRVLQLDPVFGRAILLESVLWDASRARQRIAAISVPLLLLQSSDIDAGRRLISMREGARNRYMDVVAELVPQADLKVVPGVGHFAALEAPERVSREIQAFVERLRPSLRH